MIFILNIDEDDENSHAPEAGCTSESKWRDFLNEVSLKSPAIRMMMVITMMMIS